MYGTKIELILISITKLEMKRLSKSDVRQRPHIIFMIILLGNSAATKNQHFRATAREILPLKNLWVLMISRFRFSKKDKILPFFIKLLPFRK